MKTTLSRLVAATVLLASIQSAFSQTGEPMPPPQQVIVVVRHGEDLDNWIKVTDKNHEGLKGWKMIVPDWPTYSTSSGDLTVTLHGLSPKGEEQAVFLRDNLQRLMKTGGWACITKVITKTPCGKNEKGEDVTPNPFDTIYPFLKGDPKNPGNPKPNELILIKPGKAGNPLLDAGLVERLPNEFSTPPKMDNTVLPATGSTLLCWDAEGLWGESVGVDPNKTRPFDENCILRMMGGRTLGDKFKNNPAETGGGCPKKAARIYVFMNRPGTGTGSNPQIPQKFDCEVIDVKKDGNGKLGFYEIAEMRVDESTGKAIITESKAGNTHEIILEDLP
ncbi:MAG: hypothetical protein NTV93_17590 [Verrucomicrobia bacterium]|nr:hypothetical protein [Verrucomicrobiota bacterium]